MRMFVLGGSAAMALVTAAGAQTPGSNAWHTVVRSGMGLPGTPYAITNGFLGVRVANDGSYEALVGVFPPNVVTHLPATVAPDSNGVLRTIAYQTLLAPDYGPDRYFQGVGEGVAGPHNVVAFEGIMGGYNPNEPQIQNTIWYWHDNARQQLAVLNQPAPGLGAGAQFGSTAINDGGGRVVGIDGGGNVLATYRVHGGTFANSTEVYWYGQPGNLMPVSYEGAPVAGGAPVHNSSTTWLAPNGRVWQLDQTRVLTWTSGTMSAAMTIGTAAPGIAGRTVTGVFPGSTASNGDLLVTGFLSPTAGSPANDRALFRLDAVTGASSVALRSGVTVAGVPGASIGQPVPYQFNSAGQVLFTTQLSGTMVGGALCITTPAGPQVIVRQNQILPEGGGNFTSLGNAFAINDFGQVAFNVPYVNQDSGVYGWTREAGLFLILRTGSSITLDDGVTRTVQTVTMGLRNDEWADTSASGLLNDGTLFLSVRCTDGTAAVVTALIPSPGALAPLALSGIAVSVRRRRR